MAPVSTVLALAMTTAVLHLADAAEYKVPYRTQASADESRRSREDSGTISLETS